MKSQPSPDSIKKLQAQIQALEQKKLGLEASTKAAQDEWDDRRKQIASDTKIAADAARETIAAATKDAKVTLAELQDKIKAAKTALEQEEVSNQMKAAELSSEIASLEREKRVLQTTNNTLREDNQSLISEIKVSQETLGGLRDDETTTKERLSDLANEEITKTDELDTLHGKIDQATTTLEKLNTEYDTNKGKYEQDIAVLEQKRDALITEITNNQEENDKIRDNLAAWAKTLEDKDENLRIREEKVNMQQKAISRNYGLLNL